MNRKFSFSVAVCVFAVFLAVSVGWAAAQGPTPPEKISGPSGPATSVGSGFTYQGQLKNSGSPVNGNCDFTFRLWSYMGMMGIYLPVGSTITETNVAVTNSLFNVYLDFGTGADIFNGEARWLGIGVRCPAGSGSYTDLGKQGLSAAPYALSLRPGAVIQGTAYQTLKVTNNASTGSVPAAVLGEIDKALDGFGVFGVNSTDSFTGTGVFGQQGPGFPTASDYGGVVGKSTLSGGRGVVGEALTGIGVYGHSNVDYGVRGESTSSDGVRGYSASGDGVYGTSTSAHGVFGSSFSGIGVYGSSSSGHAGYFSGNVTVNGNLSASGTKPFKIDNPLNPAKQYLYHYAIESPQVQNMYNGTVVLDAQGEAGVTLPAYFSAVNSGEFQYQLTAIGAPMPNLYIAAEIKDNHFKIAGGAPGKKVSWMVFGQRNDPWVRDHPQPDVVDKPANEADTYLYPEGYGQPVTSGVDYTRTHVLEPSAQPTTPTAQP